MHLCILPCPAVKSATFQGQHVFLGYAQVVHHLHLGQYVAMQASLQSVSGILHYIFLMGFPATCERLLFPRYHKKGMLLCLGRYHYTPTLQPVQGVIGKPARS